jgi:hypothetical protein
MIVDDNVEGRYDVLFEAQSADTDHEENIKRQAMYV